MARKKNRQPFEPTRTAKAKLASASSFTESGSGFFDFMRDHGVRETVESILVAVVLALMFRAFEAEAFIIPTGSMAPSLQGQHLDVVCEECGCPYRTGDSLNASSGGRQSPFRIATSFCPVCRYGMTMQPGNPDHKPNNGDRILVNKFVYDFKSPERFDVIVFKNPNNGKQNYIKRLVGLPGDRLLIENGDIYNFVEGADGKVQKTIVRKPVDKIDVMLHLVDDTHYISKQMRAVNWPSRWQEWSSDNANWTMIESQGIPSFSIAPNKSQTSWLRYRHLAPRSPFDEATYASQRISGSPRPSEWQVIENGQIPLRIQQDDTVSAGALIRDHYEYNDRVYDLLRLSKFPGYDPVRQLSRAAHWVGDLAMECNLEIESESGFLDLDLVEGGVHFVCRIDLATGEAVLQASGDDGNVLFDAADNRPTAKTPINQPGKYEIRYGHLDDMVYLWVNGRYVDLNGSSYTLRTPGRPVPRYSPEDPGDSEPIGVGATGAAMRISRLKVFRDIYYVSPHSPYADGIDIENETGISDIQLVSVYENPLSWNSEPARQIFQRPVSDSPFFVLGDGEYFPMGDNSPASQDARIWDGDKHVDQEFLIGRALFIYWPHSLNRPIKYFPNFKRMGFIR